MRQKNAVVTIVVVVIVLVGVLVVYALVRSAGHHKDMMEPDERGERIASTLIGARSPAEVQADVEVLSAELPQEAWEALSRRWDV